MKVYKNNNIVRFVLTGIHNNNYILTGSPFETVKLSSGVVLTSSGQNYNYIYNRPTRSM